MHCRIIRAAFFAPATAGRSTDRVRDGFRLKNDRPRKPTKQCLQRLPSPSLPRSAAAAAPRRPRLSVPPSRPLPPHLNPRPRPAGLPAASPTTCFPSPSLPPSLSSAFINVGVASAAALSAGTIFFATGRAKGAAALTSDGIIFMDSTITHSVNSHRGCAK